MASYEVFGIYFHSHCLWNCLFYRSCAIVLAFEFDTFCEQRICVVLLEFMGGAFFKDSFCSLICSIPSTIFFFNVLIFG